MKKIKMSLAFAAIAAILFSACKKADDTPAKTTQQLVQGTWNFQKEYYHENYGGVEYRDTTIGLTGEYADFRTDGKIYFFASTGNDTLPYSVVGNDKIVIDYGSFNDTSTIQVLTDHAMQLYTKEFDPSPDFYEYTTYFTK
jgi:hypothetical protein